MRSGMVLLLLIGALALGQEKKKPKPDTPKQAAFKALRAFKAKDRDALKALAEKDEPDPWLVADHLCAQGKHDAAHAFAKAAPRKDVERLPAYVESQRGNPDNAAARRTLAAAKRALATKGVKAMLVALQAADTLADDVVSVKILYVRGIAFNRLRRLAEGARALEAAAKLAKGLGWLRQAADALRDAGANAYHLSDWQGALAAWERHLAIEESRRNRAGVARALGNIGLIHRNLGAYPKALSYQERSLKLMEQLGDRAGIARALSRIGVIHENLDAYPKALSYQERALKLMEELGDRLGVAVALGTIGNIHRRLGAYPKALSYQERSLKLLEELGNRAGVAMILGAIGRSHQGLGAYRKALPYQERSLKLREELGDGAGIAATLGNIGRTHQNLGAYPKALSYQERSLKLMQKLGDRNGIATGLANIGTIHTILGAYAKALSYQERSLKLMEQLGDRAGIAKVLGNIGLIHQFLGAYAKALSYQERSLKLDEELGNRAGVATSLGNIGSIHQSLGDHAKALSYQERSLKLDEELGNRAGIATDLGNIGVIHQLLGAYAKALSYQERSLRLEEELGNRDGIAIRLGNIGVIHRCLGDYPTALKYQERARALASDLGSVDTEVISLWNLAHVHLAYKNPAEAAKAARRGVEKLPSLLGRLAEEQGAKAGERWVGLLDTGVGAGIALKDPAMVFYFLESGRAGGLLESLGGREALGGVGIPKELRKKEIEARAAVLAAQARHGQALKGKDLTEIKAAREALGRAREMLLEVAARIQRDAKAAANVTYPEAAKLETVQAGLGTDEALVLYALLSEDAVALVVTRKGARIVPLGKIKEIKVALEAAGVRRWRAGAARGERGVGLPDRPPDPFAGLDALKRKLVAPLGLGSDTKRLLVSPAGELAYLPFALLATEKTVVYVPSGTTYRVLLDEARKRGAGVLALGDPDYGTKRDAQAVAVFRRGGGLVPLPGTRAEAKAIGDRVLLGPAATERELSNALRKRKRWRAVHLACHGLVDLERPLLSSLALSPDPKNDGFLTVLEVFRMKIPADLVVLSACQTGKGKVYRTEGVVGFTRGFMFAGAPRVIVSLWKVDDEATRALMVKFYELWKPGKVATATALKKAQEFVRDHPDHPKWKHPYYWAAWQLWGLPN